MIMKLKNLFQKKIQNKKLKKNIFLMVSPEATAHEIMCHNALGVGI